MATLFAEERNCDNGEDCISQLQDDILLTFLSRMGMKEAVKTSVLSKRWRYLWANQTHLDFSHLILLPESNPEPRYNNFSSFVPLKSKYINLVNQVVGLHCGPCIDTFRVSFWFDSSDALHIDKWLRFALSKKVQNLELDLIPNFDPFDDVDTIGLDITKLSPGVGDYGFTFLKSLYLSSINVSGDILEYLLSRCCLLERLYVEGSETLVSLKVVGISGKLKKLTIRFCVILEEVVIDAVNLIYFELLSGNCSNVVFKSTPVLVEAAFGGPIVKGSIFQQIAHLAAQISKLTLDLMFYGIRALVLPIFCNLKQLDLRADNHTNIFDLVAITHLLVACPVLHEFKLEIAWFDQGLQEEAYELRNDVKAENVLNWDYFDTVAHIERKTHPNLKVLYVGAFSGCSGDVGVILFLVVLASNLETIICDPFSRRPEEEIIEASRSRANKLVKIIPPKISVVII